MWIFLHVYMYTCRNMQYVYMDTYTMIRTLFGVVYIIVLRCFIDIADIYARHGPVHVMIITSCIAVDIVYNIIPYWSWYAWSSIACELLCSRIHVHGMYIQWWWQPIYLNWIQICCIRNAIYIIYNALAKREKDSSNVAYTCIKALNILYMIYKKEES
jgi:hypothetical protein